MKLKKPRKDRTGEIFGRLKVIGFSHYEENNKGRKLIWNCICECDKIVKVWNSNLVSGNNKSCGCLSIDHMAKLHEMNKNEETPFNMVYNSYRCNAKLRNFSFNLTKEQVKIITQMECYYCGEQPSNIKYNRGQEKIQYIYNGIDRKNNSIGYEIENCVACCKRCNLAKGISGENEFYDWIIRVFNYLNIRKDGNIKCL
jgi:hypothetical protein